MLFYRDANNDEQIWATYEARIVCDHLYPAGSKAPLSVACRFYCGKYFVDEMAVIDTAAPWTVLSNDLQALLEEDGALGPVSEEIRLSTRLGSIDVGLRSVSMGILTTQGEHYISEGICAVSADWTGPTILGFHGFLEQYRFAIDPGCHAGETPRLHLFHFNTAS